MGWIFDKDINMTDLPKHVKKEIGEATRLIRTCILGKQLAEDWEVDPSNISRSEQYGYGEINKVIKSLLSVRNSTQFGVSKNLAEEAIKKTLSVICQAGGYYAYRPIEREGDNIHGLLEAAKLALGYCSNLIEKINDSMADSGPAGKELSREESKEIDSACDDLIQTMLALKHFVLNT